MEPRLWARFLLLDLRVFGARAAPAERNMQRVMIVGQPGSGKSTLARMIGQATGLPVFHMDQIHWQPGWVERPHADKLRLAQEVEARPAWVFEGGLSATYRTRMARADLLIWLDVPVWRRLWRVTRRSLAGRGQNRPDLPSGCPEKLSNLPEFWRFIWTTRRSARVRILRLTQTARPGLEVVRLRTLSQTRRFLNQLSS